MRKYDKILTPDKQTKEALEAYGIKFDENSITISKSLLQKIIDFVKGLFKKGDK